MADTQPLETWRWVGWRANSEEFATACFYQYGDIVVGVSEVTTFCLD